MIAEAAGKIAVVTGGNRGLGLEACRQLARAGAKVILASRDPLKGEAAARTLREQEGLSVTPYPLDVTDPESVRRLADFIGREFGRVDILINNVGVFKDSDDPATGSAFNTNLAIVRETFETNVNGPLMVSQTLIPLMKGSGRVVNVSSGMGQLSEMNGGSPGYRLSKAALNALTRIFADELKDTNIKVNSVCPGWVRTDMGGPNAPRSPKEGTDTIVWLATLPDDGPTGGFFRDRKPIPW